MNDTPTVQNSASMKLFTIGWKVSVGIATLYIAYLGYQYAIERDEPLIRIVARPALVKGWYSSGPMLIARSTLHQTNQDSLAPPFTILLKADSILTEVRFTNQNPHIGRVLGYSYIDTASFEPILLTHLLNLQVTDTNAIISELTTLYELTQHDTQAVKITFPLQNISNQDVVLHYLFIYKGDNDVIRYTYYCAAYKLSAKIFGRVQDYFVFSSDQQIYGKFSDAEAQHIFGTAMKRLQIMSPVNP